MYNIDDVSEMLEEIVDEIPTEFFDDLNGGIVLLDECPPHPESLGDLFILGQYQYRWDMGRSIHIYYGSFMRIYSYLTPEKLKEKLRETLEHELTHHWESKAREKGLEIEDAIKINEYKRIHKKPKFK